MWRNVSIWHVLVIVIALVLIFGWKRLPDMSRSVGQSLRIFKSEVEQLSDKDKDSPSAAAGDTVQGKAQQPSPGPEQPTASTEPPDPGAEQSWHTAGPGPDAAGGSADPDRPYRHDGPGPRG